jgi:N6-L-threonylcarbamoyladenine synthase
MPSLAQRMHKERIDFVIDKAVKSSKVNVKSLDAIAVTTGPGLSIALAVGVEKAKELAKKYKKKLIAVNHLEGHVLSPIANLQITKSENIKYPALGLVVSGGNTVLVKINKIGEYETLAQTTDDALGEALDKAARMLGLGYPGGAILEKMAHSSRFAPSGQARSNPYKLPVPLAGQEKRAIFTYSGLKSAMMRLVESEKRVTGSAQKVKSGLTKEQIYDLGASFQNVAFEHLIRIVSYIIQHSPFTFYHLLVGGGVAANVELRKRLRLMAKKYGIRVLFPYSKKLYGDNAAMIGVAAYFKVQRGEFVDFDKIDRNPNLKIS